MIKLIVVIGALGGYFSVPHNQCLSIATIKEKWFYPVIASTKERAEKESLQFCGNKKCVIYYEICNK